MSHECRGIVSLLSVLVLFGLPGCATWSTSSVEAGASESSTLPTQPTRSETILISEGDVSDRRYVALGDVTVTVNKTTVFHADPTKEMVNQKLKEEAARLGADAVIFVRYGAVGVSFLSWGSLEGKGRAIRFLQ